MRIVRWEGDAHMALVNGRKVAYIFQTDRDSEYEYRVRFLEKMESFSAKDLRKIADFLDGKQAPEGG